MFPSAAVADVTWTFDHREACRDFYEASGVVRRCATAGCDPMSGPPTPIDADDSGMIVDRSTNPPTYRMGVNSGLSDYEEGHGIIDGDVFGGGVDQPDEFDRQVAWRFTRVGSTPTSPIGCVEPPIDRIDGRHTFGRSRGYSTTATITWTRAATDGCVDTFTPAGTAAVDPHGDHQCLDHQIDVPTATIAATDGTLTIDRSTNPPTFHARGGSSWPAVWSCSRADDSIDYFDHPAFVRFGDTDGVLTGAVTQAGVTLDAFPEDHYAWTLTR